MMSDKQNQIENKQQPAKINLESTKAESNNHANFITFYEKWRGRFQVCFVVNSSAPVKWLPFRTHYFQKHFHE